MAVLEHFWQQLQQITRQGGSVIYRQNICAKVYTMFSERLSLLMVMDMPFQCNQIPLKGHGEA
jgi:hypothetical protein